MSDDKLIDFSEARARRRHDLNDKRLEQMRQAFEQALPLSKGNAPRKKKGKSSPKKR